MPEKFPVATGDPPVTAGSLPADPGAVLTKINPLQQRTSCMGDHRHVGHRSGTLPRSVTRFGLLLGASFPLGLLIMTPGLLGWGSPAQLAWVAALGWLALPVWPLVLARRVLNRPSPYSTS
jgi:hypothetical protein